MHRRSGRADAVAALVRAPVPITEMFVNSPARVSAPLLAALVSASLMIGPGHFALAADESGDEDNPGLGVGPLSGSYQGVVLNGDDFDPVLTAFSRDSAGRWSGTYAIGEEDGIQVGVLDDCEWEAAYLLRCNWNDAQGSGAVRWLFAADYRAFRGYWGENAESTAMPWDGMKQ